VHEPVNGVDMIRTRPVNVNCPLLSNRHRGATTRRCLRPALLLLSPALICGSADACLSMDRTCIGLSRNRFRAIGLGLLRHYATLPSIEFKVHKQAFVASSRTSPNRAGLA